MNKLATITLIQRLQGGGYLLGFRWNRPEQELEDTTKDTIVSIYSPMAEQLPPDMKKGMEQMATRIATHELEERRRVWANMPDKIEFVVDVSRKEWEELGEPFVGSMIMFALSVPPVEAQLQEPERK